MADKIIKTVIQIRRDTEANWLINKHVVPAAGEPCLTLDGKYAGQVKFGDGVRTWEQLKYSGIAEYSGDGVTVEIRNGIIGIIGADKATSGQSFRISADGTSIEWYDTASKQDVETVRQGVNANAESITNLHKIVSGKAEADSVYTKEQIDQMMKGAFRYCGSVVSMDDLDDLEDLKTGDVYQVDGEFVVYDGDSWEDFCVDIDLSGYLTDKEAITFKHVNYEISNVPRGTLVNYTDKEIRVMCLENTQWTTQNVGPTGDSSMYYMAFKAYAPANAVSFKEDTAEIISDNTMHYFEGNSFAGIDAFGRKYSICWLALARLDANTGKWTYYGAGSTFNRYIGWYYSVEWYDTDGIKIGSDTIRISLSNESCHSTLEPFYMAGVLRGVQLDGVDAAVVDRKVNIPVAGEGLGVVKSSSEENHVTINPDGTMTINSISWNNIAQPEGESLVLDGGSANV